MELLKLTNDTVDLLSEKINAMYLDMGCSGREAMRARLLLEEALLKYQKRFGEDVELYYKDYTVFAQRRFLVRVRAGSFDPFTLEENPMGFMLDSIKSSFEGTMPTWKYRNLENEIVFTVRRKTKINSLMRIGIATAASAILGFVCRAAVNGDALKGFVSDYVVPLSNAHAGLFCVLAVLLTFFAITLSIVRMGDISVAGAVGGKMIRRFYLMLTLMVVIATLPILPFFDLSGHSSVTLATKSIYDILIGFIPSNLVQPFIDFNSIHIIIIGAMFGFALLSLGQRGENLVKVFDECNLVSVTVNTFINKFIAIYVALKVFELIVANDFGAITSTGIMVAAVLLAQFCFMVFYTLYTCLKNKIPVMKFIKAFAPAFAVTLSSANFGAAFFCCCDGLQEVDSTNDKTFLAMNLGSVVFRPACAIMLVFSSFAMASYYNVEISAVWVALAVLLSIVLVAAVPNIPGMSVSVITLLFAQLGLPEEAISLMIAVNAPLQFLTVSVDTWCLMAECTNIVHAKERN